MAGGPKRPVPVAKPKAPAASQAGKESKPKPNQAAKDNVVTAGQLDTLQQKAYDEGFQEGRKEGFEKGHQEGLDAAQKQVQQKLQQLDRFFTALNEPFHELDNQVEEEIVALVIKMVRQLVRREIKMDSNIIVGVVREALGILPVNARNIHVILHPSDAALLQEIYDMGQVDQNWKIKEDPTIQRGGCKVITDSSQIDATLDARIDHLIAPLMVNERSTEDEGNGNGDL